MSHERSAGHWINREIIKRNSALPKVRMSHVRVQSIGDEFAPAFVNLAESFAHQDDRDEECHAGYSVHRERDHG